MAISPTSMNPWARLLRDKPGAKPEDTFPYFEEIDPSLQKVISRATQETAPDGFRFPTYSRVLPRVMSLFAQRLQEEANLANREYLGFASATQAAARLIAADPMSAHIEFEKVCVEYMQAFEERRASRSGIPGAMAPKLRGSSRG